MQVRLPTRRTAGLVLAWFFAFLLVAGIAPAAQPQLPGDICTSTGIASPVPHDTQGTPHADHKLQCALCATVLPPPTMATPEVVALQAFEQPAPPSGAPHHGALSRAPLPARGPPSHA